MPLRTFLTFSTSLPWVNRALAGADLEILDQIRCPLLSVPLDGLKPIIDDLKCFFML